MEDQLKAVEWARKQKKKILEKNYKDNKTPVVCVICTQNSGHIFTN